MERICAFTGQIGGPYKKMLEFEETDIQGAKIITPYSANDNRGGIVKCYSSEKLYVQGIKFEIFEEVYINSKEGVLRGLHFQRKHPQPRMLSCLKGNIWCAAVDIDRNSMTFGKWVLFELNEMDHKIIYASENCAIGTFALEDSIIDCKYGAKTYLDLSDGIRWNDPDLGIRWPVGTADGPITSDKDKRLQSFKEYVSRPLDAMCDEGKKV